MNDFAFQRSTFISILQWLDFSLELSSDQAPHTRERFSSWFLEAVSWGGWYQVVETGKPQKSATNSPAVFSPGFSGGFWNPGP